MSQNDHHKQIRTLRTITIGNFMLEIQTTRATKVKPKEEDSKPKKTDEKIYIEFFSIITTEEKLGEKISL